MEKEDRLKLLKIAVSCLRKRGEERSIFSPKTPTEEEIDIIKKSLETGEVDENLLKTFFPMAYEGSNKHKVLKYFFYVHNGLIRNLKRYTKDKLFDWCTAYPAKIIDKIGSKWLVETVEKRRMVVDSEGFPEIFSETNLKIEDKLILHREKIGLVLNDEEFKKAVQYYNDFKEGVK